MKKKTKHSYLCQKKKLLPLESIYQNYYFKIKNGQIKTNVFQKHYCQTKILSNINLLLIIY